MQILTLKDGTKITVKNTIDPREIIAVCDTEDAAVEISKKITNDNVKTFSLSFSDGSDMQTYQYMCLDRAPMRSTTDDGKVSVIIWLRNETFEERANDKYKEKFAEQETDITNIQLALVELYETREEVSK
ncbi:MAG: hypothetical protein PUE04_00990 [Lachnospira sp.]|nr:hypothetical protein [Lachnospira sp.]